MLYQCLKLVLLLLVTIHSNFTYAAYSQPVSSKNGMVVTEHYLATQVGVDILKKGGNAIDAAVAVGYALAVVDPCCGNIGGGGFMTIRLANGKTIFLNFREKAPLAATRDMYLDSHGNLIPWKTLLGYAAVAVPGTVSGLETALQKYGSMNRKKVMAPAIKLANQGFILTKNDINRLYYDYHNLKIFRTNPNVSTIFLKNNQPYKTGERLIQKDLANSLVAISKSGANAFYHGEIAKKIVTASQANGGLLTLKDFSDYTTQELSPITCNYRSYEIISAPPPSSGGITLCEILNILEGYNLKQLGFHSAQSVHYIVEAMRFAYADRNKELGDPDFVNNPIAELNSKTYAAKIRESIQANRASPPPADYKKPAYEYLETTHYSVTDKQGNAVSVTYTLDGAYGANVIPKSTGILLNNEMDDFTSKINSPNLFGLIQGPANSIAAGKRPLSSMTPTIITKNNELFMVIGGPGGPRIITSVLLTILNVIDYQMDISQAVNETRIHHQWLPDEIAYEQFALSADTQKILEKMGYHLTMQKNWGAVAAIMFNAKTHTYYGAMDARRPLGSALGN